MGTLNTNASGDGYVTLKNITASAGQAVTVGDLQGTLAQAKFAASLTSPTSAAGVSGNAEFVVLKSKLILFVQGAADNTTYNVTVNNVVVGQFTTNAKGFGKLILTLTNATIQTGSTISIADTAGDPAILQGTFS